MQSHSKFLNGLEVMNINGYHLSPNFVFIDNETFLLKAINCLADWCTTHSHFVLQFIDIYLASQWIFQCHNLLAEFLIHLIHKRPFIKHSHQPLPQRCY